MKLTEKQRVHLRDILKSALAQGVSEIVFEKVDGSVRVLRGTRDQSLYPAKEIVENQKSTQVKRKENTTSLPVYDIEAGEFRSFKIESLVSINGLKADALVRLV
ncbi:tail fiber protein [Serratia phage 4S]|nr:tail fiber protein [Serratia phage 4S]